MKPVIVKRSSQKRTIKNSLTELFPESAIGEITHNCEIFGLTGGQFSLVDIILHCIKYTGPVDVTLSTWTAANADLKFARDLMSDDIIKSMRFLVDYSFKRRQPIYCQALQEYFGDDCIRVTKNHCKFVLLKNDKWSIVIRTSMNLNENKRLESFEISDDDGFYSHLNDFVDMIFREFKPEKQQQNTCQQDKDDFGEMVAKTVMSQLPLGINVSKIGLSTKKGVIR
jgi:hypothetical protein